MKRATTLILLAGFPIAYSAMAQGDHPSSRAVVNNIRLVLILGSRDGAPEPEETLTIRLSNVGKTTLRFPEPGQLCGNSLDGFVMVYKRILSPSKDIETGGGCIADRFARTDVLAEAKKWKTLAPKAVYEFTVPLRSTLSLNPDGRYELTAKYYPPHFTSAELSLLAANDITVVQETIQSPPIVVEPQQP